MAIGFELEIGYEVTGPSKYKKLPSTSAISNPQSIFLS
jgi:hypothetical protein